MLPNDRSVKFIPKEVEVVIGDLCDTDSMEPFFTVPAGCTSVIIHCASMVTVDPGYSEKLMSVNVGGTRNIITKVLAHPECEKMVYVSSTGAIPEQPHGTPITEVSQFTPCDPKRVVGAYSLSKATATQMVLDSVRVMGCHYAGAQFLCWYLHQRSCLGAVYRLGVAYLPGRCFLCWFPDQLPASLYGPGTGKDQFADGLSS